MQNWQLALVLLLAVLVGAALPVLIQLFATLRTARSVLRSSGEKLDGALAEATAATAQIRHVVTELDSSVEHIQAFFAATSDLSGAIQQLSDKVRMASAIGAAVGPAVVAAVRAFRDSPGDAATDTAGDAAGDAATTQQQAQAVPEQ